MTKRYGDIIAVHDLNIEIKDREFIVLLGPSGCGKSTTLNMIAGLEEITDGELWFDEQIVNALPPHRRDVAMVFQSYALYPHKTVYENIAFGLRMRKLPAAEVDRRVREAAAKLEIAQLLNRRPSQLSGGQRQRVALGRAMVRQPSVFLMDEPLSNLDAALRISMRAEIKHLHTEMRTTFVYVTHDQAEALTLADRIVVMNDGRVQQIGTAHEIYERPANMFVASFLGNPPINYLKGELTRSGDAAALPARASRSRHPAGAWPRASTVYKGGQVCIGIRAEDVDERGEAAGRPRHPRPRDLGAADRLRPVSRHGARRRRAILPRRQGPEPRDRRSCRARRRRQPPACLRSGQRPFVTLVDPSALYRETAGLRISSSANRRRGSRLPAPA